MDKGPGPARNDAKLPECEAMPKRVIELGGGHGERGRSKRRSERRSRPVLLELVDSPRESQKVIRAVRTTRIGFEDLCWCEALQLWLAEPARTAEGRSSLNARVDARNGGALKTDCDLDAAKCRQAKRERARVGCGASDGELVGASVEKLLKHRDAARQDAGLAKVRRDMLDCEELFGVDGSGNDFPKFFMFARRASGAGDDAGELIDRCFVVAEDEGRHPGNANDVLNRSDLGAVSVLDRPIEPRGVVLAVALAEEDADPSSG